MTDDFIKRIHFDEHGLVPAVVQEAGTSEVLMLAWMDAEAIRRTVQSGRVTYWSRSRQEYWRKGDTSGNIQQLQALALDCDADTILLTVVQHGAACHTGTHTCFEGRQVVFTLPSDREGPRDA